MRSALLAAAVLAASASSAGAFHPLISEDTGFLGTDARQIELGVEHSVSREGPDADSSALSAEFSYGFSDNIDLLVSAPWRRWSSGGASESGLGDVSIEAKFEAGRAGPWTIAMKPGLSLPSGDEAKGLGAGKKGAWLYAIAGRTAGPWQFYLNAGYFLNRNSGGEEEHIVKGSAAAALKVAPGTMLSADLTTETSADPAASAHPLSSVLGLVWSPHDYLDLDAGVRLGLNDAADDLGLLAGMTLRF